MIEKMRDTLWAVVFLMPAVALSAALSVGIFVGLMRLFRLWP